MLARLQAWLATHALVLGVGAGAAGVLAWERHAPFGLGLAQKHADTVHQLETARDQVVGLTASRDGWHDANARCEAVRTGEARANAVRLAAEAEDQARTSSGAFDQGYAAGRAVGRRSCEGETRGAVPTAADPVGDLVAKRVRDPGPDFAAEWRRGAYQPGDPVRAGAGRAVEGRARAP